jgi:hypothetical protein
MVYGRGRVIPCIIAVLLFFVTLCLVALSDVVLVGTKIYTVYLSILFFL